MMRIQLLMAAALFSTTAAAVPPGPLLVNANGDVIGFYVGESTGPETGSTTSPNDERRAEIITSTGYRVIIDPDQGHVAHRRSVYFESLDCSGQGYVEDQIDSNDRSYAPIGAVFATDGSFANLYFVPKSPDPAPGGSLTIQAQQAGSCGGTSGATNIQYLEAFPNDPNVTGFDPADLVPPLELGVLDLFRDGFESSGLQGSARTHIV